METKELADLLNVVPNTVRRWCSEYHEFLTPTAHPPKGKNRVLTLHDARVLHYVAAARDTGQAPETVRARLAAMQGADWANLPDVPPEWENPEETMLVTVAAERAYDVARVAVLQRELEMVQQQLQQAARRAETAEDRVLTLENEINAVRASQTATEAELQQQLHAAQLELRTARGEVETLRARLSAYAITGGSTPIPVALIILVSAVAVAVLVIVLLIVVRLVL